MGVGCSTVNLIMEIKTIMMVDGAEWTEVQCSMFNVRGLKDRSAYRTFLYDDGEHRPSSAVQSYD